MWRTFLILLVGTVYAAVVELTPNNWNSLVVKSGKKAFVKFYAPWCGHCKKMKPDWDKLGDIYSKDSDVIIGDVDCTGSGKDLCQTHGIKGFPTLKSFWRTFSDDYSGSRSFDDLKSFAEKMTPMCAPGYMENCSEEERGYIETMMSHESSELLAEVKKMKQEIQVAEEKNEEFIKGLQKQYEDASEVMDDMKKDLTRKITIMEMIVAGRSPSNKDEV